MFFVERLKSMDCIRRPVKKIKIVNEYIHDAKEFCKYYMEECDRKGQYEYHILMLVHNIEKGMCMPNPRPFGKEKIKELMKMICTCEEENTFRETSAYSIAISIMHEWLDFYAEHEWTTDLADEIDIFLKAHDYGKQTAIVGYKDYLKIDFELEKNASYEEVVSTRKSVRTYANIPLRDDDVAYCVRIAQMAPTACNRQMIGILQVSDRDLCDMITKTIHGASGFSEKTVNYFVITFDINAFNYYGERNQGYLNAGFVAMNFVNALHSRGIGSCFLQWANSTREDQNVRKALDISDHEKIAVVIGAGYYEDQMRVAKSYRRDEREVFRKI